MFRFLRSCFHLCTCITFNMLALPYAVKEGSFAIDLSSFIFFVPSTVCVMKRVNQSVLNDEEKNQFEVSFRAGGKCMRAEEDEMDDFTRMQRQRKKATEMGYDSAWTVSFPS